jgi:hypothetical protein
MAIAVLVGAAATVVASAAHAADANVGYRWRADGSALVVAVDGRDALVIEGIGPVWHEDKVGRGPTDAVAVRQTTRGPVAETRYRAASGAQWKVVAQPSPQGEFVVKLFSTDGRFDAALPGKVTKAGRWVGLDLSQYAMAYSQPQHPKTYYLAGPGLFLCAWWDAEVAHASQQDWPDALCHPRSGEGPFAPASTMKYVAGPDGRHANLREALHVRVARHLWDAALPSLCRPSEYGREMVGLVYLDDWSGQSTGDMKHMLGVLKRLAWPHVGFLSIVQNWEAGGFDALLPDSMWMPDYPPNPVVGSVEKLRAVTEAGKALGRFGFRTNYMLLREQAPSRVRKLVDFAQGSDGKPSWYTQPSRWEAMARRQETEIVGLFGSSASFTDQLGSGGVGGYLDFNRAAGGDGTMASAVAHQHALARLIKETCHGPLGTESMIQQDLMGYYCDFGDYGIMDGHDRLFTPEYKLRRLQGLTVNYGCGLYYRFFEMPPCPRFHANQLDLWTDPALMDDYRCCEVLLGNGGYICWPCPWPYAITEAILVGRLQKHYGLAPVASVEYETHGAWKSLEEMVRGGFCLESRTWVGKQNELGRIRVVYGNGLTVIGNRLPQAMKVTVPGGPLVLPQYGWVAFRHNGSFLAYSAFWPGTEHRVDFLEEGRGGLRLLNPRGATLEGASTIRLWKGGKGGTLLWSVDPVAGVASLNHERLVLKRPAPAPLADLSVDFSRGLHGWQPVAGVLQTEKTAGGVKLAIASSDPQICSPPLWLTGHADDVLLLRLSTDAGTLGQLYFSTTADPMSERQVMLFHPTPDGQPRTIEIPIGRHAGWAGHRITAIRLDPIHGPASATVVLYELKLQQGQAGRH